MVDDKVISVSDGELYSRGASVAIEGTLIPKGSVEETKSSKNDSKQYGVDVIFALFDALR